MIGKSFEHKLASKPSAWGCKPRVLLLSTYSFGRPRHGGQVRLANIAKTYLAAGFEVLSLAVCETHDVGFGKDDIVFPDRAPFNLFEGQSVLFTADVLSGQYAADPNGAWPQIRSRFLNSKINVIHAEQPWLWPLVVRLQELPSCIDTVLVYGSQNIEAPLRADILHSYGQASGALIHAIERLERQAACEADLVLAVTPEDGAILQSYGAKRVVLASNGIAPWSAEGADMLRWQKKLPQAPWAFYVASAHPPNFTGFLDCVGQALGGIPPDSKLVVAGSVCEHLQQLLTSSRWSNLNLARTQYLGMLSDIDLAVVKSLATVYCLPIAHGGGSNIKTAEAIYSGAQVIGSPAAFRGFEQFLDLPQIHVVHSASQFQTLLATLLSSRLLVPVDQDGLAARASLAWSHCLASIPLALSQY